jgi:hypothetical protein
MVMVGPAVDGMIASSRRRLLAHLGAGHADGQHWKWKNISGACITCGI